jgi:hypothetical protein
MSEILDRTAYQRPAPRKSFHFAEKALKNSSHLFSNLPTNPPYNIPEKNRPPAASRKT